MTALIEIGGLLAVFQISIALNLFHKMLFYRAVSTDPERVQEVKNKLTLESLEKALTDIEELKNTNAELAEKLREYES